MKTTTNVNLKVNCVEHRENGCESSLWIFHCERALWTWRHVQHVLLPVRELWHLVRAGRVDLGTPLLGLHAPGQRLCCTSAEVAAPSAHSGISCTLIFFSHSLYSTLMNQFAISLFFNSTAISSPKRRWFQWVHYMSTFHNEWRLRSVTVECWVQSAVCSVWVLCSLGVCVLRLVLVRVLHVVCSLPTLQRDEVSRTAADQPEGTRT